MTELPDTPRYERAEAQYQRQLLDQATAHITDPDLRAKVEALRDGRLSARDFVAQADFSTTATNAIAAFTEQYATMDEERRQELIDAATGQIAQIAEQGAEPTASRRRPSAEEDESWPDGGVKWESF